MRPTSPLAQLLKVFLRSGMPKFCRIFFDFDVSLWRISACIRACVSELHMRGQGVRVVCACVLIMYERPASTLAHLHTTDFHVSVCFCVLLIAWGYVCMRVNNYIIAHSHSLIIIIFLLLYLLFHASPISIYNCI